MLKPFIIFRKSGHSRFQLTSAACYGIMLVMVSMFASCKQPEKNPTPSKGQLSLELMSLDKKFSDSCLKLGKSDAFMKYLDSNGILLRPNFYPIEGYATTDYLLEQQIDDYEFSLFPKQAEVAESGDLGFTYGVYQIKPKDYDTTLNGTYTKIWRKQANGEWKLSLNAENQGVGE